MMTYKLTAAFVSVALLSACGEGATINPTTWFQRTPDVERLPPTPQRFERDFRDLTDTVSNVVQERLPGGILVTATGVPATQGWWNADLVLLNDGEPVDGALVYEFRIAEPLIPQPPGTVTSREVVVGVFVSDIALRGVSRIVIRGERNEVTFRPRSG